jgi:hypothetical protein
MSTINKSARQIIASRISSEIDKRRPSALEVLDRVKLEDPLERVRRLEGEIVELRASQLRTKGLIAEIRRLLDSLEKLL